MSSPDSRANKQASRAFCSSGCGRGRGGSRPQHHNIRHVLFLTSFSTALEYSHASSPQEEQRCGSAELVIATFLETAEEDDDERRQTFNSENLSQTDNVSFIFENDNAQPGKTSNLLLERE